MENIITQVEQEVKRLEATVVKWAQYAEDEADVVGSEIVSAVVAIFEGFGPTALAELRSIIAGLPADFKAGATLATVVEEVLKQGSDELVAAAKALAPQFFQALIAILLKSLGGVVVL